MSWVAPAVGAVTSVYDDYRRKKSESKEKQRQAPWKELRYQALSKAGARTLQPYTPFTGDRVAGMGWNESLALDKAATGYAGANEYLEKAGQTLDEAAGSKFDQQALSKYSDPYIEDITKNAIARETENFQARREGLRGQSAQLNALGGYRHSILEAQNTGRHLQTVGDMTAEGYERAFSDAYSRWTGDRNLKMQTAQRYQEVGGDIARLNNEEVQQLMQTGGADRVLRQLASDKAYSAFIETRDWDVNNIEILLRTLGATHSEAPVAPKSDSAAELMGTVATMVGYFGKTDQQNTTTGEKG